MVSAIPQIDLSPYAMIDLILGAQRFDGYSHRNYQTFPEYLQQALTAYTATGGSLMVSGAYLGEDLRTAEQRDFAYKTLKYMYTDNVRTDSMQVRGMGTEFGIASLPNPHIYHTARVNAIQPTEGAFATLLFNESHTSYRTEIAIAEDSTEVIQQIPQVTVKQTPGAVAYQGSDYRSITYGFPLEMIFDKEIRRAIINASFTFLCNK